jgi:hypothetical protein
VNNKFTWKGLKVSSVGLLFGAISIIIIYSNNNSINYIASILILIGTLIVCSGIAMHYKEIFRSKDK